MDTNQLRQTFLDYFRERGHTEVQSSSLVPINDPTLLFTNAGMVQFKNIFLGLEKSNLVRAVSSQRCVRAGGKHNDLENVGYTSRHHTFFEMLGNFSFGDYFKREAIQYAWDFLTNTLKLPAEKLWVTVYEKDAETADIWLNEMKIDPKRFSKCGEKDNFWSMGDTGPCGPCTEIFYDHGPSIAGGPPGSKDEEGDRYVEIWNLVFMQYDRSSDSTLSPLPKPSVDTGSGLERLAAVVQGVHSNYDIDIFQNLIQAIAKLAGISDLENKSLRVIADHIRACAFLIVDGVFPSNEGRGYVLRRICRRAIRHGHRLGFQAPFFYKLVKPLAEEMGDAYPELLQKLSEIERVIHQEELQFARTLDQGMRILEQDIASIDNTDGIIPGNTVFKLYDTYGFPVDLTADIARERGLAIDRDGFNEAMAIQRTRAREASQFTAVISDRILVPHTTDFTGYETLEEESKVMALFLQNEAVNKLEALDESIVVLDHTPFYAEAGGQVGDQGILQFDGGEFEVRNTKKLGQAYLHYGILRTGTLKQNTKVFALVDKTKRKKTAANHSATHLLHASLRKILGNHVQQKGSLVEPERLRFDFSHFEALTPEQIRAVEQLVNEQVRQNSEVVTEMMTVDKALESGAMALFGEKYDRDKPLRVLHMGGDFSVELCGGTHVKRTGDIGLFKIVSQASVAAGVRRLEAVTGVAVDNLFYKMQAREELLAALFKCKPEEIPEKAQQNQQYAAKNKQLEKEIQQLKLRCLSTSSNEGMVNPLSVSSGERANTGFREQEIKIDSHKIKVVSGIIPDADAKTLREMIDELKSQHKSGVFILASFAEQKAMLIAGLSQDYIDKFNLKAGDLVKEIAGLVGGQGGGRADMAQAGGNNPEGIEAALEQVPQYIKKIIQADLDKK